MSGYVIAQIKDIKDKEIYKQYVSKVTPIVEKLLMHKVNTKINRANLVHYKYLRYVSVTGLEILV